MAGAGAAGHVPATGVSEHEAAEACRLIGKAGFQLRQSTLVLQQYYGTVANLTSHQSEVLNYISQGDCAADPSRLPWKGALEFVLNTGPGRAGFNALHAPRFSGAIAAMEENKRARWHMFLGPADTVAYKDLVEVHRKGKQHLTYLWGVVVNAFEAAESSDDDEKRRDTSSVGASATADAARPKRARGPGAAPAAVVVAGPARRGSKPATAIVKRGDKPARVLQLSDAEVIAVLRRQLQTAKNIIRSLIGVSCAASGISSKATARLVDMALQVPESQSAGAATTKLTRFMAAELLKGAGAAPLVGAKRVRDDDAPASAPAKGARGAGATDAGNSARRSQKPAAGTIRILDMFCGTGSVAKAVAKWPRVRVDTMDWDEDSDPTFLCNVLEWDYMADVKPGDYDFVWASVPCTKFSALQRGRVHTEYAEADSIVKSTLAIIEYLKPKFWLIENPANGILKTRPYMVGRPFYEVSYCQYGMDYQKHTALFYSKPLPSFVPRKCPGVNGRCAKTVGLKHKRGVARTDPGKPEIRGALAHAVPQPLLRDVLRGTGLFPGMPAETYVPQAVAQGAAGAGVSDDTSDSDTERCLAARKRN